MAPFRLTLAASAIYPVALFGDSIVATGWANIGEASFFTATGKHMSIDTQAVPGQTQPVSWATAQTGVPAIATQPSTLQKFALWQFYSQNDDASGATVARIQYDYDNYIQQFIDLCHANNVIPILMTHIPSGSFSVNAGADGARKAYNDLVRARAASDVLIFDPDPLVTDGGSPAHMLPGYVQADGTHLTGSGANVLGAAFDSLMRDYYNTH